MKIKVNRSEERGVTNAGWLLSKHSFSFGSYYNPSNVHFGLLRVLNDDSVAPAEGFGTHSHNNMEIISIALEGELAHKDSMGHQSGLKPGEVQVMSAGTGISHSEFNGSDKEPVKFLQIWIFPKEENIKPRYDQKKFALKKNEVVNIVSGLDLEGSLYIHQDAVLSLVEIDKGKIINYKKYLANNVLFIFIIDGEVSVGDEVAFSRDSIEITSFKAIDLKANIDSKILLIEIPEA
ncbi:MAG TPA: pirin family protein [Ignavibacteriaceae bacterium]|nr:pirin family protein [Ignavibacteriaceae bacterium]